MRRLKDLDVHEISLVKRAANKRRYLIVKSDLGASQMAKSPAPSANAAHNLMAAMASIPREKIEHIAAIAKSAKARVAKADEDGSDAELQNDAGSELSEDAQNALKAAFRILAPYSDAISADTMADFSEALGVEADVAGDADNADADETVAMSEDGKDEDKEDDVGKADTEGEDKKNPLDDLKKADDDKEDEGDDSEKAQKAADDEAEGDDVPPSVTKADGMPDFADADDSDMEAAMAAARTAYAAAMEQRGKKQAAQKADEGEDKNEEDDDALTKSAIEKSAFNLSALDKRHQRILEPVFKSHLQRFAALEKANQELIAKSAKLDDEMRRREYIAKAAREYSALGPAEEIGENLLRLHKKDPDGVAAWERIMKAANEQMRQGGSEGLFEELGTAMSGGLNSSGLPDDEIKQHVDAIVQKSATGKSRERLEAEFLLTPVGRRLYAKATNRN